MRSFAFALISSLLLSPISVLATYDHDKEHSHHPKHHDKEHSRHPAHEDDHSVSKVISHPTKKVARIVVSIDYLESDVEYICQNKERSCYDHHGCDDDDRKCVRENKCHKKKKECLNEFKCDNRSRKCHRKTTNRYGFRCGQKFYNQQKILKAARAGCRQISNNKQRNVFPALHTAFEYSYEGPYVEWPINHYGVLLRKFTNPKHRLVMTMDCAVVGAVVRNKRSGKYSKCRYERH